MRPTDDKIQDSWKVVIHVQGRAIDHRCMNFTWDEVMKLLTNYQSSVKNPVIAVEIVRLGKL